MQITWNVISFRLMDLTFFAFSALIGAAGAASSSLGVLVVSGIAVSQTSVAATPPAGRQIHFFKKLLNGIHLLSGDFTLYERKCENDKEQNGRVRTGTAEEPVLKRRIVNMQHGRIRAIAAVGDQLHGS